MIEVAGELVTPFLRVSPTNETLAKFFDTVDGLQLSRNLSHSGNVLDQIASIGKLLIYDGLVSAGIAHKRVQGLFRNGQPLFSHSHGMANPSQPTCELLGKRATDYEQRFTGPACEVNTGSALLALAGVCEMLIPLMTPHQTTNNPTCYTFARPFLNDASHVLALGAQGIGNVDSVALHFTSQDMSDDEDDQTKAIFDAELNFSGALSADQVIATRISVDCYNSGEDLYASVHTHSNHVTQVAGGVKTKPRLSYQEGPLQHIRETDAILRASDAWQQ